MVYDRFIGWDIGGAHLKVAEVDSSGKVVRVRQIATPLWQGLSTLQRYLAQIRQEAASPVISHAFTTTAELVDIFPDRRTGLTTLSSLIAAIYEGEQPCFYAGDHGWATPAESDEYYDYIASANWHATASYMATVMDEGILIDIGSTTTDIVPFKSGKLLHQGRSDFERLSQGELVYTGVIRTPVMALTDAVLINGEPCPLIAEHFATMADVYRMTGDLSEQDDMQETADKAGKSKQESARRLARMVGADYDALLPISWTEMASQLSKKQCDQLWGAFERVSQRESIGAPLIGAGAGRFLARKLAADHDIAYIDFAELLDTDEALKQEAARAATAVSVAQLSRLSH